MYKHSPGRLSDDEMLALLKSVAPARREPSEEGVRKVLMLVSNRADAPLPFRVPRFAKRHRALFIVGAIAGTVLVGGGSAFAAGVPVPEPLRALAVHLGLPVTTPAVASAENAIQALRADLNTRSRKQTLQVARDTRAAVNALNRLDPHDRARLNTEFRSALTEACQALSASSVPSVKSGIGGACSKVKSVTPTTPVSENAPSGGGSSVVKNQPSGAGATSCAATSASGTSRKRTSSRDKRSCTVQGLKH